VKESNQSARAARLGGIAVEAAHAKQRAETSRMHVVVLGASISGLMAARALADHVGQVTLIERDELSVGASWRKGVPQASHAHGILASGLQIIEEFFPGIIAEACSHGASCDDAGHGLIIVAGSKLHVTELGVNGLVCGRPLLEALIRRRVLALPNVTLRAQCVAQGLVLEEGKVRGVRLAQRAAPGGDATISADLVLDATGRGSRASNWFEDHGYAAPRVERVEVGINYTSALYRRKPGDFHDRPAVLVDTVPPNRRSGVANAIHPDHWIVTLIGYLGERTDPTHQGFLDFASGMPSPELHDFLRGSEPVSEFTSMGFRQSQRCRFDHLERHPDGFIVTGDALCSFNPRFGQGVAVAAHEARALAGCVQAGGQANLWRRYYDRIEPLLDAAWSSSVGNDVRFAEVEGKRTRVGNLLNRYVDRLCSAGSRDAEVSRQFLRVIHMLDKPESLFSASMLARLFVDSTIAAFTPRRSTAALPRGGRLRQPSPVRAAREPGDFVDRL